MLIQDREDTYLNIYKKCLKEDNKYSKQIKLDISRTLVEYDYYKQIENRERLERVLKGISSDNKDTGYLQGMNFVVGYFLMRFKSDEVETFKTMSELLKNFKYGLRGLYSDEFPRLFLAIYQVDMLTKTYYPVIHERLKELELDAIVWLTPWMFTLFSKHLYNIGIENYNIFIDDFLKNGWSTIIKFAMIILEKGKDYIMTNPYEKVLVYLNDGIFETLDFDSLDIASLLKKTQVTDITLFQLEIDYVTKLTDKREDIPKKDRKTMMIICSILTGILTFGTLAP